MSNVSPGTAEQLREWVAAWKRAGPELERIRFENVRQTKTADAIAQLSDAFEWALRQYGPRPSSGLVEQQAIFKKLRQK
jgi:hypothetical protein